MQGGDTAPGHKVARHVTYGGHPRPARLLPPGHLLHAAVYGQTTQRCAFQMRTGVQCDLPMRVSSGQSEGMREHMRGDEGPA